MRFRHGSDIECAPNFVQNLGKSATGTLAMIRQAFCEGRISSALVFKWHVCFSADRKRVIGEEESKQHAHPFDIKGIVPKNSSWQLKQSIPYTILTFHGDCEKMCEHFALNFGDKEMAVETQQRSVSYFLFHQTIF
jgi:hypothetical protein